MQRTSLQLLMQQMGNNQYRLNHNRHNSKKGIQTNRSYFAAPCKVRIDVLMQSYADMRREPILQIKDIIAGTGETPDCKYLETMKYRWSISSSLARWVASVICIGLELE
jgi:hypothetical protein